VHEQLQPYFLFLLNDPEVGHALIAKDRFQVFGAARGLPVPPALTWEGDGPGSLRGARGPVVVKPKAKMDWHQSEIFHSLFGGVGKARVFASSAGILADPGIERFRQHLYFQEYIPGTDRDSWSFHGFADERGELLASFVGRKVRSYPVGTGESAFIEMAHDEELTALGREVTGRCPLRGVFKMDFRRDPRDGRWYLLEINARYNLWHYLGAVNGVNLPAVAYRYLAFGKPSQPSPYEARVRWLSWRLDLKAYRELAARNETTLLAWASSILRSRNVYSSFNWNDPVPWVQALAAGLRRRWRRVSMAMRSALRQ
jgi:D-aspartate ligase